MARDDMECRRVVPSTIAGAAGALRAGSLTCQDLARTSLDCIEQLEPELNSFIEVTAEQALNTAAELDAELEAGKDRGPLHGIPVCFKDLFDFTGVRTTVGSRLFERSQPKVRDSAVVRLLRTAGVVSLGKNNMAEFSADMTGRNSCYGDMHNPWKITHSPCGSSGGTAAAVAAGMCYGGVGSDTGGSVRLPASVCGIVGIRPTKGLVRLEGAFPRAHTLDVPGPLSRTVHDAATLLDAMVGVYVPSRKGPVRVGYTDGLHDGVTGLRLGIIDDFTFRGLDADVANAVHAAVESLSNLGAESLTVEVSSFRDARGHAQLLDVLLYEFHELLGPYRAEMREAEFGPMVREDLEKGASITRYQYEQALTARKSRMADARRAFDRVDVLLTPTQPLRAPYCDSASEVFDQLRKYLSPTSFIGLPSVSTPCGFDDYGLPVGLQIIGNYFQERMILRVAAALEGAIDFGKRLPAIRCHPRP